MSVGSLLIEIRSSLSERLSVNFLKIIQCFDNSYKVVTYITDHNSYTDLLTEQGKITEMSCNNIAQVYGFLVSKICNTVYDRIHVKIVYNSKKIRSWLVDPNGKSKRRTKVIAQITSTIDSFFTSIEIPTGRIVLVDDLNRSNKIIVVGDEKKPTLYDNEPEEDYDLIREKLNITILKKKVLKKKVKMMIQRDQIRVSLTNRLKDKLSKKDIIINQLMRDTNKFLSLRTAYDKIKSENLEIIKKQEEKLLCLPQLSEDISNYKLEINEMKTKDMKLKNENNLLSSEIISLRSENVVLHSKNKDNNQKIHELSEKLANMTALEVTLDTMKKKTLDVIEENKELKTKMDKFVKFNHEKLSQYRTINESLNKTIEKQNLLFASITNKYIDQDHEL